jgi:thiamine transport system substrate-binding protein
MRFGMRFFFSVALLSLGAAGCQPGVPGPGATPAPRTLNIMTHDSFDASAALIDSFEQSHNVRVNILKSGDSGAALNKAILSKDAPLADVFFGVDNTFLSRALGSGIFDPYDAPALRTIPDSFKLDPQNRALPVDYGDVCINYDIAYFSSHNMAVPQSLDDLAQPEYRGLLVVEDPATSSPGLAFLLATVAHFGDPGYLDFWRALRANGLVVVDGWETAYNTNFSAASGHGPQPMVISYASSPPAEVVFSDPPLSEAPTSAIINQDMCFRQLEFVGILRGTANRDLAEAFIDFMLSTPFQEDMPLKMFVFPVDPNAALPEVFTRFAQIPSQPATLAPEVIAAGRDRWIQAWHQAVLE